MKTLTLSALAAVSLFAVLAGTPSTAYAADDSVTVIGVLPASRKVFGVLADGILAHPAEYTRLPTGVD